jgi:hypothetical protein
MTDNSETLLRAILMTVGRQAFSSGQLAELVAPSGSGAKQLEAFNLCDGSRTQGDIAKALKLDSGNFSRTVARWIEAGILFRLGAGRDATLLHVYPVAEAAKKKGKAK